MKRRGLFTHIYFPYLAVILVTLAVSGGWSLHGAREEHYVQTRHNLEAAARMMVEILARLPDPLAGAEADALCKVHEKAAGYRFTVVLSSGKVIGDSLEDPKVMDNHSGRPEIRQLFGEPPDAVGWSERRSGTVRVNMMYVAVPWVMAGERMGFVRAARAMSDVDLAVTRQRTRIIAVGLSLAVLGAIVSALIARHLSEPLDRMSQGVKAYAAGNAGLHLPSSPVREIHALAEAMNAMASHLNERFQTIVRQRDEQNALLACMTEAVIAVDDQGRVLSMNPAALDIFQVEDAAVAGRPILEAVRNADLQRLWREALDRPGPFEDEFTIPDSDRCLQAHGTALKDAEGGRIGAVIVMNDITRLRRLETMRRDFVANVSHELKTPVTSIQGFAETLLEGAAEQPEERERFLKIIAKQADRLKSIIEDLMALSSLEHDADSGAIVFHPTRVRPLLECAVKAWQDAAAEKSMTLDVSCDAELKAVVNAPLLEQAMINLVGNAVKHGLERTAVSVAAERVGSETVLSVADQGPGIARQHLPRLFERFYRVDRGRSRSMGGTGLGLAIVKRVAIAHGGRVEVDSHVGKGSVFKIMLPHRESKEQGETSAQEGG